MPSSTRPVSETSSAPVVVDDDGELPHSDEVIEELFYFDIEEWDWQKVNICSEVIFKAAKNAEKATLHSSVKNWSGTVISVRKAEIQAQTKSLKTTLKTRNSTQLLDPILFCMPISIYLVPFDTSEMATPS